MLECHVEFCMQAGLFLGVNFDSIASLPTCDPAETCANAVNLFGQGVRKMESAPLEILEEDLHSVEELQAVESDLRTLLGRL